MAREPQLYEIGLLIKPELSEVEAAAELGNVRSEIEKQDGMMESTTDPKLRKLSYPIKKIEEAYFAALQFSALPAAITGIEKEIKTNDAILRHLVLSWTRMPASSTVVPHKQQTPAVAGMPQENTPQQPEAARQGEAEEKIDEKELDKKLDEILGN